MPVRYVCSSPPAARRPPPLERSCARVIVPCQSNRATVAPVRGGRWKAGRRQLAARRPRSWRRRRCGARGGELTGGQLQDGVVAADVGEGAEVVVAERRQILVQRWVRRRHGGHTVRVEHVG